MMDIKAGRGWGCSLNVVSGAKGQRDFFGKDIGNAGVKFLI